MKSRTDFAAIASVSSKSPTGISIIFISVQNALSARGIGTTWFCRARVMPIAGYKDAKGGIPSERLIDPHSKEENPRNLITFVLEDRSSRENSRVTARPVGGNQRAENTIRALNLNDRKLSETRRNYLRRYEGEIDELRKKRGEEQDLSRVQKEAENFANRTSYIVPRT